MNWPIYARVLVEGFGEESDYGTIRDEMDSGLAKQRSRFTKRIVTRQVTIAVLARTDKVRFDDWVATDLRGGAEWFDMTLCGNAVQARIVGGKVSWGAPAGQVWKATLQLESIGS